MGCDVRWSIPCWNSDAERKHIRRGPREQKNWERSILAAFTGERTQPSIFDPGLSDQQIEKLVMRCVIPTKALNCPEVAVMFGRFTQNALRSSARVAAKKPNTFSPRTVTTVRFTAIPLANRI